MDINLNTREVNVKVVYYGPGLSGKTTNLEIIHARTPEDNRGKLTAVSTDQDRTLFFDYMPLDLGEICGLKVRLRLFTVPGQVYYNSTRKLVLRRVDGVVFVADSQEEKEKENLESLANLKENLAEYNVDIDEIPLVMQFNKRDLGHIMPLEEMEKTLIDNSQIKYFPAVAVNGDGVFQSLRAIANLTMMKVEENLKKRPKAEVRKSSPPKAPTPANALPKIPKTGALPAIFSSKPKLKRTQAHSFIPPKAKKSIPNATQAKPAIQNDKNLPNIGNTPPFGSSPVSRHTPFPGSNTPVSSKTPLPSGNTPISSKTPLPGQEAIRTKTPFQGKKKLSMPKFPGKNLEKNTANSSEQPQFSLGYKRTIQPSKSPQESTPTPYNNTLQTTPPSGLTPINKKTLSTSSQQSPVPFSNLFKGSLSDSGPSNSLNPGKQPTSSPRFSTSSSQQRTPKLPSDGFRGQSPTANVEEKKEVKPQPAPIKPEEAQGSSPKFKSKLKGLKKYKKMLGKE